MPPQFDRHDIVEAFYAYAVDYHAGQFSRAYKVFGRLQRIQAKPCSSVEREGYEALSENGKEIYAALVARNY